MVIFALDVLYIRANPLRARMALDNAVDDVVGALAFASDFVAGTDSAWHGSWSQKKGKVFHAIRPLYLCSQLHKYARKITLA